jgi:hypothetical protein
MDKILYLLSVGAQKDLIEKHCFVDCGKILVGAIKFCGGYFIPCKEKDCAHEEDSLDVAHVLPTGENCWVRKLK